MNKQQNNVVIGKTGGEQNGRKKTVNKRVSN